MDEEGSGSSLNMRENVAGLLCYVFGWVSGLVMYLLEKKSRFVRFHAVQSMVTFGILSIVGLVFRRIPVIGGIIGWATGAATFVAWAVGMVRAYQGKLVSFPFSGDVAKRLAIKDSDH
jgi:uncharacterized membrane protein